MKCPYCAEDIKDEAIVCMHCHRDLALFKPFDTRLQAIESDLAALTECVAKISAHLDQKQTGSIDEPRQANRTSEQQPGGTKEAERARAGKLKKPTKWRMLWIVLWQFVLTVVLLVFCGLLLFDLRASESSYYDYAAEEPQPLPSPTATAQSTPAPVRDSGDKLQPNSLCGVDERIIFSCTVDDSDKIVSVCGSKDLADDRGYLQYRFGLPAKIELEYPEDRNAIQGRFQYFHYPRSPRDPARTHIYFNIDGDDYQVFEESYSQTYTERGVSITAQDKSRKVSNCGTQAIADYRDLDSVLPVNESAENEEAKRRQPWEEKQEEERQQSDRRSSLILKIFVAAGFVLPIALGLWIGCRWQGKNLRRYVQVGLLCGLVEGGIMAIVGTLIVIRIWTFGGEHYSGKFTFPIMLTAAFILIGLFRSVFGFATGGLLGDWIERRRNPQLYGRGFSDLMALQRSNRRENLGRFARATRGLGGLTSSVAPLIPLMGVIITSVIGYYAAQAGNAGIAAEKAKAAAAEKAKAVAEEKQKNKQAASESGNEMSAQSPQP